MAPHVQPDPFAPLRERAPKLQDHPLEAAWFDAPARRSTRPPKPLTPSLRPPSLPPAPIDDAVADVWFR